MSVLFATILCILAHALCRNYRVVLARTSFMGNALENGSGSHRRVNVRSVRTISGHDRINDLYKLIK